MSFDPLLAKSYAENAALKTEIATLTAALEAAKKDAERLDWCAKNLLRDASIRLEDGTFKACKAWSIASATPDLRGAIDAVITKETKNVE